MDRGLGDYCEGSRIVAQFEKRIKTTTVHQYVLPNPANHVEVNKALLHAYQEYTDATGKSVFDDSVWITHADDEIIIYWEEN